MNEQLHNVFVRSFDAVLTEDERVQLVRALSEAENRVEYDRLVAMRTMLRGAAVSAFKPFFIERLLQRILSFQEEFRRWLLWDFRRIALVGIMSACLLVCYNVSSHGSISLAAAFAQREYTLEQALRLEVPFQ